MDDDYRGFFQDRSTLREEKETLDRTKLFLRLIDAVRNMDHIREVRELIKDVHQFIKVQSELTQVDPQVEVKFLEVYQSLVDQYLDSEEINQKKRLTQLIGLGKDPKEEAIHKAWDHASQVLASLEGLNQAAKEAIQEAGLLLQRINKRLDELLENQQMDQKMKDKLKLIKERIS